MLTVEELRAWIALSRAPMLAASRLSAAIETLGDARGILCASDAAREAAGLSGAVRAYLSSAASLPTAAECAWLDTDRNHLVPFTHPRFPASLRSSERCPIALYVRGNAEALQGPQLAVVGSRNPTAQGRETAFEFAEHLAGRGLAVTSGLALGIDSEAHRGALAAQGTTIAILGCGADRIYPHDNMSLADAILYQGALISHFPLGTLPRRENFPQRNRLIATISMGTLVVEAARQSGSLITGRMTLAEGKPLFAVPGSIYNPVSRGCHALIREGAKLTESPDDILKSLDFPTFFAREVNTVLDASAVTPLKGATAPGMDKAHKILLDAVGFDPADLDLLVVRTGLKPDAVSSMMLILELEGHVQAAPGGRYSRVVRSRG